VAKGGYKVAKWAAKKAIKAARERLTTKGQTERIKRQQKNEKEKAALVKAKAQRAQAKKNQPKKQWWFNK
jgi:serine/threonine protein phosphatase PrpC